MGASGLQIIKTVNYEGKISIYFGFRISDFEFVNKTRAVRYLRMYKIYSNKSVIAKNSKCKVKFSVGKFT